MTFNIDLGTAVLLVIGNAAAVLFAAGILYNKVDGTSSRLQRLETLIDQILVEYFKGQKKEP